MLKMLLATGERELVEVRQATDIGVSGGDSC